MTKLISVLKITSVRMYSKHSVLSIPALCIIITAVIYFALIREYSWKGLDGRGYSRIINSDGVGYYKYLPNIFLNNSIGHQIPDGRYILKSSDKGVNKYFVGTAISMLPFFGLGYLIAYIQHDKLDGFSFPFQKAVSLAALFYMILGLFFMKKFLFLYKIRDITITVVIFLISFGTNLITSVVLEPSMSHIYSFCFITAFLYFTKMLIETEKIRFLYISAFIFGMIILIRPVNALIIFLVPFLAGSFIDLKRKLIHIAKIKYLFIAALILFCLVSIQPFLWYIQTGDLILWSYKYEGFYFTRPEIWNFLFSFRKGLFIYTPLCLVSLSGFYIIFKKSKFEFFTLLFFLLLLIYIFSSWWNWYYGPSFGQRVFVEFYGIISLLLAISFEKTYSLVLFRIIRVSKIIYLISLVFVTLNLIQNYQYYKGIMSAWDMNYTKYKYIFLKTSDEYIGCLGGNQDILPFNPIKRLVYQINNVSKIEYISEFNRVFNVPIESSFITPRVLFAEVSLDRFELQPFSCSTALFVIDIADSAGRNYYYYTFHINDIPYKKIQTWKTFRYTIEIPKLKSLSDKMKLYIWNIKKQAFIIDNLNIKIYTIN